MADKFQMKTFFFEITRFLQWKLSFVDPSGSLKLPSAKKGPRYQKDCKAIALSILLSCIPVCQKNKSRTKAKEFKMSTNS